MFRKKILSLLLYLLLVLSVNSVLAQGTLMIDPKRLVLENNKRSDIITLYNSSNDTTNYFITLKHFDMLESGELKDVDSLKSGTVFADSLIRFFPRGVRLTPHSSQVV